MKDDDEQMVSNNHSLSQQFEGIKNRLREAKKNNSNIKIFFIYPGNPKPVIRRGIVININNDSFDFDDIYDGLTTLNYNFIAEITSSKDKQIGDYHGNR